MQDSSARQRKQEKESCWGSAALRKVGENIKKYSFSLFLFISSARRAVTPQCPTTQWICSRGSLGLATLACHHCSASNPKLPINSWAHPHLPEGTMTFPSSPLCASLLTDPTLPPKPRSVFSKHAPRDAAWVCDVLTYLQDIYPHLGFCPSVRALNYEKEEKVNLSVVFPGSNKSVSVQANWQRHGVGSELSTRSSRTSQRNLSNDACLCAKKKC